MPYKDKEKQKEWALQNKEKIRAHKKKWRDNNKEYHKSYDLDGYFYVYHLEDYNYIGATNSIARRFRNHKSECGRDCTNYKILHKCETREEALELEKKYHDMGYEGKHSKNLYK
jgi:hypothetical protein